MGRPVSLVVVLLVNAFIHVLMFVPFLALPVILGWVPIGETLVGLAAGTLAGTLLLIVMYIKYVSFSKER